MKIRAKTFVSAAVLAGIAGSAGAQVYMSKVFVNPPGSNDDTREFIEITGTPNRRLDGYAIAGLDGLMQKYYVLGSLAGGPPALQPEVDEFFSLDGLSLGANGILVIGIGTSSNYSTLLSDTNFQRWNTIWNGGLDVPGKLQNDGSHTVVMIRRRPGTTQADPTNPAGVLWGKDGVIDAEYSTNESADVCSGGSNPGTPCYAASDCTGGTCLPGLADRFGDGQLDRGNLNGYGGFTPDLIGKLTPGDPSDDVEIVDEVSWEQDHGQEYDTDDRRADVGSNSGGLKERKVHNLGDPQGFNPDVLVRVDYRTKGAGWNHVAGATGQAPGDKNWQDTATEQWIRGESLTGASGQGSSPYFYLDNTPNSDPNSIQPYQTNVPKWLADGSAPDFDFSTLSYQIMAGRVNPLAVAFIPGDANRDGACNQQDIDKIASVFGDADWIFSNAWGGSPEGNDVDPSTQTRPWDLDGTGDNGIEPSDLQWALNFQGNTDGRVVGVRYDSTTASTTGVVLNSPAGMSVTVGRSFEFSCGATIDNLYVGDIFTMYVSAQVTGGANTTAGQQNGVMQFVQDVTISGGGVIKVLAVAPAGAYATTREAIQVLAGAGGDLGVGSINGYTTSFTQGLGSAATLYAVTFQAVGLGSVNVGVRADDMARFAAGTPRGVKLGHAGGAGNPGAATYPSAIAVTVANECRSDFDRTGFTDTEDYDAFVRAFEAGDQCADFDLTGFVDTDDFDAFVRAFQDGC